MNEIIAKLKADLDKLADRFQSQKDKITSEAQSQISLINPFISALGYDRENVDEVEVKYFLDNL